MGLDPYEPPAPANEVAQSALTKPPPHSSRNFLRYCANGCGGIALLCMFMAYSRMMFPPEGRYMGDIELFILASPFALAGIGFSCIPEMRRRTLFLNLFAAVMVAAPFIAAIVFGVNFPPRLR